MWLEKPLAHWVSKELFFFFAIFEARTMSNQNPQDASSRSTMVGWKESASGTRSEFSVLITEHRGFWPGSRTLGIILDLIHNHFVPNLKGGYAKDVSERRMLVGRHDSLLPSMSSGHLHPIWGPSSQGRMRCPLTQANPDPQAHSLSHTQLECLLLPESSALCHSVSPAIWA